MKDTWGAEVQHSEKSNNNDIDDAWGGAKTNTTVRVNLPI